MRMIKVATFLTFAAFLGVAGCSKNKAGEAIKACQDCKNDSKCVDAVSKKYSEEDLKGASAEDQAKYVGCLTASMAAAATDAINDAMKEVGKALGSAEHH